MQYCGLPTGQTELRPVGKVNQPPPLMTLINQRHGATATGPGKYGYRDEFVKQINRSFNVMCWCSFRPASCGVFLIRSYVFFWPKIVIALKCSVNKKIPLTDSPNEPSPRQYPTLTLRCYLDSLSAYWAAYCQAGHKYVYRIPSRSVLFFRTCGAFGWTEWA